MNTLRALILAGLLAASGATYSHAQTLESTWAEVQAQLAEYPDARTARISYSQLFASVPLFLQARNFVELERTLTQANAEGPKVPEPLKNAINAFSAALQTVIAREVAARDAAIAALIEEFAAKFKSPTAAAADFDDLLARIGAQLNTPQNLPRQDRDKASASLNLLQQTVSRWQDFLVAEKTADRERARAALRELSQTGRNNTSTLIPRSEFLELLAAAEKRADLIPLGPPSATDTRIEALFSSIAPLLDSAKAPAELDAAISTVIALERDFNRSGRSEPRADSTRERLQAAKLLLTRWQDRLAALARGDTQRANAIPTELANNGEPIFALYSRSKLLAAIPPPPRSETSSNNETPRLTLDDVPTTLEALATVGELVLRRKATQGVNSVEERIANLHQASLQLAAGDPQPLVRLAATNYSPGDPTDTKLTPLRIALLVKALPRYLELPATITLTSSETPLTLIDKAMDDAHRRADWLRLLNILQLRAQLGRDDPQANTFNQEQTALRGYLAGLNQEKAGQLSMAVTSYRRALATPARYLPLEDIGRRLDAIRAKNPEAFTEADERETRDMAPRFPGRLDARPGAPNLPAAPEATPPRAAPQAAETPARRP